MEPKKESTNYSYTLYKSSTSQQPTTLYRPTCPPLSESTTSDERYGHFTTMHSSTFQPSNPETPQRNYQEPLFKQEPYQPPPRSTPEKTVT